MSLIACRHLPRLQLDIFGLQAGEKAFPVCFKAFHCVADLGPEIARQP